ncbi:MAG: hypothetical protein QOG68_145 [Solirubrobacteraceae bacterium]|jgi:hypothetical protein|nr:hypothetical protein [Solirubrobacteraceae bacterium]
MFEKDLASRLASIAVRRGGRGFTFDELVAAANTQPGTLGDVVDWLAKGCASGLLQDMGFDAGATGPGHGPRRYRLIGIRSPGGIAAQRPMPARRQTVL